MKTKKRSKILSLLLALSMLVGMVPFSVIPAMAAGFGDVQVTSSYPYDPNPQWVEITWDSWRLPWRFTTFLMRQRISSCLT